MVLIVDVEERTVFLEGGSFLIPLSERQAHHLAFRLERAATKAARYQQSPANDVN